MPIQNNTQGLSTSFLQPSPVLQLSLLQSGNAGSIEEKLIETDLSEQQQKLIAEIRKEGKTQREERRAAWRNPGIEYFRDQTARLNGTKRWRGLEAALDENRVWLFDHWQNPLLNFQTYPQFDKIDAQYIMPAISQLALNIHAGLAELEESLAQNSTPKWEDIYPVLNELYEPLHRVWVVLSEIKNLKSDEEFNQKYSQAKDIVVDLSLRLSQSKPAYDAYSYLRNQSKDWFTFDSAQRRIIDQFLLSAKFGGIELTGEDLERFNEIEKKLSGLQDQFRDNTTKHIGSYRKILRTQEDVAGLTEKDRKNFAEAYAKHHNQEHPDQKIEADPENGPWLVNLASSYLDFMKRSENRELRKELFLASNNIAAEGDFDNTPLIPEILKLRQEKAKLLGFETYAELSLASKMAGTVKAAEDLIRELWEASYDKVQEEREDLQKYAEKLGFTGKLQPWDAAFYIEKMQKEEVGFNDAVMKDYYTLPRALEGLFEAAHQVFGFTVKPADGEVPVWHDDVRFFKVYDANGKHFSSFYYDPYERPGQKRPGAWMDELINRKENANGRVQKPVGMIVTNFERPSGEDASRLTLRNIETLFHEFGHLMQLMLTEVGYVDVAGTSGIEWDAVEVASQLNEYWLYQPQLLKKMSSHHETGESIPDELIEKILKAKTFRAATSMIGQLVYAASDLEVHHRYDPDQSEETPNEVYKRIYQKLFGQPAFADSHRFNDFNHLFGGNSYSAGYYSYKWAEVLAADYFSAFEANLDDPEAIAVIGQKLRETLYALGGSYHPAEVFRLFMGRDFSTEALLRDYGLQE